MKEGEKGRNRGKENIDKNRNGMKYEKQNRNSEKDNERTKKR